VRAVEAAGANVTVILIAPTGWATGAWARDGLTLPPGVEVEFPAYAHADAVAVLARSPPTASPAAAATVPGTGDVAAAFEAMLGACVLPTFGRDTVDLDALRHAAAWLWPLYAAPGVDGGRRRDDLVGRRAGSLFAFEPDDVGLEDGARGANRREVAVGEFVAFRIKSNRAFGPDEGVDRAFGPGSGADDPRVGVEQQGIWTEVQRLESLEVSDEREALAIAFRQNHFDQTISAGAGAFTVGEV
jgi:hypothetical protein